MSTEQGFLLFRAAALTSVPPPMPGVMTAETTALHQPAAFVLHVTFVLQVLKVSNTCHVTWLDACF